MGDEILQQRASPPLFFTARLPRLAIAATTALLLVACSHAGPGVRASRDLQFYGMRSTIELAPVHYAIDALGASQTEVRHGGVPNLFTATDGPLADLAGHAETQVLRNSLQNPDVRILLTITEGHYRVIARRSAGIETVADLAGKRIATMNGTSAAFYLHKVLLQAGLDEADVAITSTPRPHDISRLLINREVDALAIWEPEAQIAVAALGEDAVILDPDVGYSELYNLHTTAAHLGDPAMRARIVDYVASVIAAQRAVVERPGPAIALVSEASGYPAELIERSWQHHSFPGALSPALLDTLVEEDAWLAAQEGREPRSREQLTQLIDGSVVTEAKAQLEAR